MKQYLKMLKKSWQKDIESSDCQINDELTIELKEDYEEYGEIKYDGIFLGQITYSEDEKHFDIRLAQLSKMIDEIKDLIDETEIEIATAKYMIILSYVMQSARMIDKTGLILAQA